jgi:hypothetical protein
MKSSAQTDVRGVTVLEPTMLKEPVSSSPAPEVVAAEVVVVVDESPQLPINAVTASKAIKGIMNHIFDFLIYNFSS